MPDEFVHLKMGRIRAYKFVYGETPTLITRASYDRWVVLAASGSNYAQKQVANLLYAGDGIERDVIVAYAWALLATQDPRMKDWGINLFGSKAIPELTTKQKNEGERLAANWKVGDTIKRDLN